MTAKWWLGPAYAMQPIPAPRRDYSRTADDAANAVELLGGRAVQRRPVALSTYQYEWTWKQRADWAAVKRVASGAYGPGPYGLLDASTANFLTREQGAGEAAGWASAYATLSTAADDIPFAQSVRFAPGVTGTTSDSGSVSQQEVADGGTWTTYVIVPAGATSVDVTAAVSPAAAFNHIYLYDSVDRTFLAADSATPHVTFTGTGLTPGRWLVDVVCTATADIVTTAVVTLAAATPAPLTADHPVFGRVPVPPASSWTLSAWIFASAAIAVSVVLDWWSRYAPIGTATAQQQTIPAGAWTRIAVTGTAPAGAVGVVPTVLAPAGSTVYVGQPRLALDDDGADWYPGEGLPAVSVTALGETVPLFDKRSMQLTLAEVR